MKHKVVFFIFAVVFLLAIAKVFLTAKLAITGGDLVKIEKQNQVLREENSLLEEEAAKLSSLSRIASEAAKLGLRFPPKITILTGEVPIAIRETR